MESKEGIVEGWIQCSLGVKVMLYGVRGSCIALDTPNSHNDLRGNSRVCDPSLDIYILKRL
jgi:hypothetical protein